MRGGFVAREACAGLLLFGALVGRADLEDAGCRALRDLAARGFVVADADSPVRVYPLEHTTAPIDGNRAAAWRPGVVSLRPDPAGREPAGTYLRHELMHEASFRTCGGRLPLWAEEAAAIAFSGEAPEDGDVIPRALDHLRDAVRLDAPLDATSYRVLSHLVVRHGWPPEPCATAPAIVAILAPERPVASALAYVVASVVSGRLLEAAGDTDSRWPPGSLMKIPYAAALADRDPRRVGEALARSDTDEMLRLRDAFRADRFALVMTPVAAPRVPPPGADEREWRALVGERGPDGSYAVQASLAELAQVVRAALLVEPGYYTALRENGALAGSTLAGAEEAARV